jgi:hypothetical protein
MAGNTSWTHDQAADAEMRIRERAYQLWQQDGAPEGKADEYWHRARQLLEDEKQSNNPVQS